MDPNSKLAIITPINPADLPDYGGGIPAGGRPTPTPPIAIPPTPPGVVAPPIALPPNGTLPIYPITIPDRPDNSLPMPPPGTIWPPLNPGDGVAPGKALLLVWIVGTDRYRWIVVDLPVAGMPLPGTPEPK